MAPEPGLTCIACSKETRAGAAFCGHCGTPIQGAKPIAPVSSYSFTGSRRIGTASWPDFKRVLTFYGLILGVCTVNGLSWRFAPTPRLELYFWPAFVAITAYFLASDWAAVSRAFKFRVPRLKTVAQLVGLSATAVFFLVLYFSLFSEFHWPQVRITEPLVDAHWPIWSIYFLNCVAPGIVEECAYRGIIQTKLTEILSAREALVIQAALFSVTHLSPSIFISHFLLGLLLGWARLRVGHVYFGMIMHMMWNAGCVYLELHGLS